MNAAEVPEDETHRISPQTWCCTRCGMSCDVIDGLRLSVCSRVLEIREGTDAIDGIGGQAQETGHSDW